MREWSPITACKNAMPTTVSATVRDVSEFGGVHVDRGPGIAADPFAGDPADVAQPVIPAPNQDRSHGREDQPQSGGDLHQSQALTPAHSHVLLDHRCCGAVRADVRPARVVVHSLRTVLAVVPFV